MKVGIITFHFPYNCGAALQCLALQTKLEELGHTVSVINYRPWYHQNRYTPLKNPIYYSGKRFRDPADNLVKRIWHATDGFLRTVHSWKTYPAVSKKELRFRTFVRKYLHETPVYRSLAQLQKNPPLCDVYIAGSDQLWNSKLTSGDFDSAYFLNFGAPDAGRMTYSVGTNFSGLKEPEKVLHSLVKNLDVISLREVKWLSTVKQAAGEIPVHVDVDPTLLLTAQQYERFLPEQMPEEPEPYILTYTMTGEAQGKTYQAAHLLSKKLGLKILDVCGDPNVLNRKIPDNRLCGPDEFLKYVKGAAYVVTNSFHGTVFSVIFQKKFVTIPHAQTGNRVTELLDKLGLSARYQQGADAAAERICEDVDYASVMEKLTQLREESTGFLRESVEKYGRKGADA